MKKCILFTIVMAVACSTATASIIEVGSGDNTAGLYVQWKDGFSIDFAVHFEADSTTGVELLQVVEADADIDLTIAFQGTGFVDGIAYLGHDNEGYGGGEDWWHYWVMDSDQGQWVFSWEVGGMDLVIQDGDSAGWVYGTNTIPEPATMLLLTLGSLAMRRRRK